ncbi:MAG: phosphoribosylanthranilate isomerase [Methanobrevibacter sp.]|jgi:phosphoribosylanthranilate isomerase|nr:phosphoribosylanthranilate isomerase [Methanobrevibacter sp.]
MKDLNKFINEDEKRVKIKICGITRDEDVKIVNEFKPDFIGVVFGESRRKIDFDVALKLKKILDSDILSVGVFVNENISNIDFLVKNGSIDLIQLHGDEDEKYINKLKELNPNTEIIKAIGIKDEEGFKDINTDNIDYLLLDSGKGSGKSFDWNLIKNDLNKPFFLAGGISQENLKEACKIRPFAIDLSSGAEKNGVKDYELIKSIMEQINMLNKV